jgi:hypothetical protein
MNKKDAAKLYTKDAARKINESYEKYQVPVSAQTNATPADLVMEMVEKLNGLDGKDVLVVANYDVAVLIAFLKNMNGLQKLGNDYNFKSLTLLTDIVETDPRFKDKFEVVLANLNEPAKIDMMGKKFDVVIGNPPYNDSDTTREEGSHRKQSRNLAKEFLHFALDVSKDIVSIIAPTSRTYTAGVKRDFIKSGLYDVSDVTDYFPEVSLSQIVTYTFSKTEEKTLNDCTVFDVPVNNLGQIYTFTTGFRHSRKDIEPLLKDEGKYKVFVTTGVIKYTDDEELVERIADKSRGNLRVVMNHVASTSSAGKLHIAQPDDVLMYTTDAFIIENVEQGQKVIDYLASEEAVAIMKKTRTAVTNSGKSFSYIPKPF